MEGDAPGAGAQGLSGERAGQTCSRLWEEWSRAGGGRTQEVCSQDRGVFPGHQRARPPWLLLFHGNCSLFCRRGGERCQALHLMGKEQVSLLMSLKGCFLTAASSTSPLGPAVLCGRLWWSFLPSSSFFRQPSQLYQNILTPLAQSSVKCWVETYFSLGKL